MSDLSTIRVPKTKALISLPRSWTAPLSSHMQIVSFLMQRLKVVSSFCRLYKCCVSLVCKGEIVESDATVSYGSLACQSRVYKGYCQY